MVHRTLISVAFITLLSILNGCAGSPILREEIRGIQKTHLIGVYALGPSQYNASLNDEQARSVSADVELRCREGEPAPLRYNWEVPGTCEGCGISFEAGLNPVKQAAQKRFSRSLQDAMDFAPESETASLEGVEAVRQKASELLDAGKSIGTDRWDEGELIVAITESPQYAKLLMNNPGDAFVIAALHLEPKTSGTPYLKTKHHRFDACEYVLRANPVKNGIDFYLSGDLDMRVSTRPGENLFVQDIFTAIQASKPVNASIDASKHSDMEIDWLEVEALEDPRVKRESVFTVKMGSYRLNRAQKSIESDFDKNFRERSDELSQMIAEYVEKEKKAATQLKQ